jgi:ribosomal protein S18 acetylase RimI-like enzyme
VTIRRAEEADLPALAALARQTYAEAFGHSFSPSDLAAHLERNLAESCFHQAMAGDVFLLAEAAGRLIGFVQFGPLRIAVAAASPEDQELRRIYVLAEFQNQGIGRRLMDAALNHPRLRTADIYLDVWEQNHIARRLNESYGFTIIGAHSLVTASGVAPDQDLIMVLRR